MGAAAAAEEAGEEAEASVLASTASSSLSFFCDSATELRAASILRFRSRRTAALSTVA